MIVIKGNLIIDKTGRGSLPLLSHLTQNRKRLSSTPESFDSKPEEIIALADLEDINLEDAYIIEGDIVVSSVDVTDTIFVTGNIASTGGE